MKPGPGWRRIVLKPSDFVPLYEAKNKGGMENEPPLAERDELHSINLLMDCVPKGTLAIGEVAWKKPLPASATKP